MMKVHNGIDMNKKNLRKLRNYLANLPRGYEEFEMEHFLDVDDYQLFDELGTYKDFDLNETPTKIINGCGTSACAVGHGPKAGIRPKKGEDWTEYSRRTLLNNARDYDDNPPEGDQELNYEAWEWCFSGSWSNLDNHHWGAARRISYLLDHNKVPEWFDSCSFITETKYNNFKKSNRIMGIIK